MKTFFIALFFLFEIILVASQDYHTVAIPGNLDGWGICSNGLTDYASFSVKLANPHEVTDNTFGTTITYTGNLETPFSGQIGNGVFVDVVSYDFQHNVPELACGVFGEAVSYGCDRDVGTGYISTARQWCLVIINPFTNTQEVDVAVSFVSSVFALSKRDGNSLTKLKRNDVLTSVKTTKFSYKRKNNNKRNSRRTLLKKRLI